MTAISGESRQLITAYQSWDRFMGFLASDWMNVSITAGRVLSETGSLSRLNVRPMPEKWNLKVLSTMMKSSTLITLTSQARQTLRGFHVTIHGSCDLFAFSCCHNFCKTSLQQMRLY